MATRLVLENVNKYFNAQNPAVSNFNLEVEEAEFLVLVGPSGCGKSTTLRMVAGLERVSSGEIFIDDLLVNDVPPGDRDVAMVFQNYALYPHMSVYDNVAFGLKMRRTPRSEIDGRVREVAQILNLNHLLKRKPRALSGGERQRVALGRAMVRHPRIFLMDEPLSNLDAQLRTQTRAEILKLHHKLQATFLYVTHDQVEALTLSTKIAVFFEGNIVQVDTPQELYDHPNDIRVANFIGNPKINFVDAKCAYRDGVGFTHSILGNFEFPLQSPPSDDVVIAIKPEDIRIHQKAAEGMIQCLVRSVLPAGSETLIQLTKENVELMVKVIGTLNLEMDNTVWIDFSPEKINIYDKSSGRRISR